MNVIDIKHIGAHTHIHTRARARARDALTHMVWCILVWSRSLSSITIFNCTALVLLCLVTMVIEALLNIERSPETWHCWSFINIVLGLLLLLWDTTPRPTITSSLTCILTMPIMRSKRPDNKVSSTTAAVTHSDVTFVGGLYHPPVPICTISGPVGLHWAKVLWMQLNYMDARMVLAARDLDKMSDAEVIVCIPECRPASRCRLTRPSMCLYVWRIVITMVSRWWSQPSTLITRQSYSVMPWSCRKNSWQEQANVREALREPRQHVHFLYIQDRIDIQTITPVFSWIWNTMILPCKNVQQNRNLEIQNYSH